MAEPWEIAGRRLARPVHVWVSHSAFSSGPVNPGLLVMWRQVRGPGGRSDWEGWVIWASTHSAAVGGVVEVHQGWLAAHMLRPAAEADARRVGDAG